MLCVKVWLSLAISLLAHFKLIVSSPLVSHSDIGSNDHGGKEVGGREMKVSKIKKEKTEKKGKSKKEKVSKVKKTKGSSSKTEVVCPEINDRRLDMLGFNIDSGNLLKKFRSNLGNIATGANFMKDLNIPKIAETVTDVSSPSIRRIQGSDDGDVRTLEHDATYATFCPNGKAVTKPDKEITEFVMLMMSLDDDEFDEVDLEMFLSNLKDVIGGTTCKDVENFFPLTEDLSDYLSYSEFSLYTFFCGCEGVQSCAKDFCPYGYKLPFPEKMLSGVGDLPKTTTCAEAREIASNFPDSNDQEKDSCSAYVRDIARYCECPCMGGKPCSICGNLVLKPNIMLPRDMFNEFAGTCGELDQLAQSSITEDSEDCNVGKDTYTRFCCE